MTFPPPAWHALLAPLPGNAVPERRPIASPQVLAGPTGWSIAGWEELVLHLSAGEAGLRIVHVVLDPGGALLSASDAVLYRTPAGIVHQESVGGRFEADGSFRGTRWHSVAVEREGDDAPQWDSTRKVPSPGDVEALRGLVADLVRRQPGLSP